MPRYKKGDLFEAPGVHIVTCNSFISQDSTLVMGLGAAYALKRKYPDAPRTFGTMIKGYCGHLGTYGLLLYGTMGILQGRYHYKDRLDARLIIYGLKVLSAIAEGRPAMVYNLTHPGMGYDKSIMPEIETVLEKLPDNVHIWQK